MGNNTKLAAVFAALMLTSSTATAQDTAAPQFNPETTATYIFNSESTGLNMRFGETHPNMQSCLAAVEAESQDFTNLRHSDLISAGDTFTILCEDSDRIVESRFSLNAGVQRSTLFKPQ